MSCILEIGYLCLVQPVLNHTVKTTAESYLSNVDTRLRHGAQIALHHPSLHFFGAVHQLSHKLTGCPGSDDRIGADFEYPSAPESQRAYAVLVLNVLKRWTELVVACPGCPKTNVRIRLFVYYLPIMGAGVDVPRDVCKLKIGNCDERDLARIFWHPFSSQGNYCRHHYRGRRGDTV